MTDEDKSRLVELVCVGDVPELLAQRVITQTSGPAATVMSQACRVSILDSYLRAIASEAIQPAARARAYKILLEGRTSWARIPESDPEPRRYVINSQGFCQD